jgi:hypothetical protein
MSREKCGCGGVADLAPTNPVDNNTDWAVICRACKISTRGEISGEEAERVWDKAMGRGTADATIVYKNGSYKCVPHTDCRTYENDPDWLVTIKP